MKRQPQPCPICKKFMRRDGEVDEWDDTLIAMRFRFWNATGFNYTCTRCNEAFTIYETSTVLSEKAA